MYIPDQPSAPVLAPATYPPLYNSDVTFTTETLERADLEEIVESQEENEVETYQVSTYQKAKLEESQVENKIDAEATYDVVDDVNEINKGYEDIELESVEEPIDQSDIQEKFKEKKKTATKKLAQDDEIGSV